ncbi:3-deoxy-manno-octulosonate cytidylyltransferase [Pseudomaricurvus alcaniphilus]|uniref:3-deoxy-manno-octulosonate cytidylyltransferase n=1 Tax=Pseudomaricurvus alcaniphilus TaxID=1166482 RepID=UPI00140D579C|nr:3-deoxy-manno-octulosonate cytidylyltransferase [Pseudomaricurvus alcaniphilus]NHN35931.1 3-deoxy-manno-octulosonate cytidylyltransferase [Pseudomaricurvus alcaniphilus]
MKFTVVIPARYASSRLPAKPLKDIAGKPMIQWVYEQASKSSAERVVVATDDTRIEEVVLGFGGNVCMTSAQHESGTDRLQEVAATYGLAADDIVVNVQGDEPLIPPAVIEQVATNLANYSAASVATLCEPIRSSEDFLSPNVVKVVTDCNGMALYFSRAPMPWPRDPFAKSREQLPDSPMFQRHIGIYAYRVSLLNQFVTWPLAPLEALECLEQLRVLWNGHGIHVQQAVADVPGGVDTAADLERVRKILQSA